MVVCGLLHCGTKAYPLLITGETVMSWAIRQAESAPRHLGYQGDKKEKRSNELQCEL